MKPTSQTDIQSALLDSSNAISGSRLGNQKLETSGFYAIWIDSAESFPAPYSQILTARCTCLLYIGIAGKTTLFERLYEQEFQNRKPGTFFRSIGTILGYLPPQGSLIGMKRPYNYEFSSEDTAAIIEWGNEHLAATFVGSDETCKSVESAIIRSSCPLLNRTHNPFALRELQQARKKCRHHGLRRLDEIP